MKRTRRRFLLVTAVTVCALALSNRTFAFSPGRPDPILWVAQRDNGKVYVLGFADAKDRSWLTAKMERAFDESGEVWFETPKQNATASGHEADTGARHESDDEALEQRLGYDHDHSLFDVLGPTLGPRTLRTATELGVRRQEIEDLRPWLAYDVIVSAFFRHYHVEVGEYPDQVLARKAGAAGKRIHSEYATSADVIQWYASLSADAQREHIEDLLDYIEDEKAGLNTASYEWITGHPNSRTIDRMRQRRPAMYEQFQVERNRRWADRIAGFLKSGGVYFVVIGQNHVLGPESVLEFLRRRGIQVTEAP